MRWFCSLGVALALALTLAAPAFPQSAPAAATKVSPKSAELVRRLYRAAHIDTTMDSMMASLMPAMTEAMTQRNPSITAEQRRLLNETVQEVMHDATPKILDRMIPAYAANGAEVGGTDAPDAARDRDRDGHAALRQDELRGQAGSGADEVLITSWRCCRPSPRSASG